MNKPVVEFTSKISMGVKLAGWEGERGISWTLKKSYKDKKTDEWKESKSFTDWDLDALSSLVAQAREFQAKRRLEAKGLHSEQSTTPAVSSAPARDSYKLNLEDDDIPF